MLDVESGGNPTGDGSDWINRTYWDLVRYCGGNARRVIGLRERRGLLRCVADTSAGAAGHRAGYGSDPHLPGQIAHQYTDGRGWGGGLPEGAPPFGNCDMNAANGLTAEQFAAACGVGAPPPCERDRRRGTDRRPWIGRRITVGEMTCPTDSVGSQSSSTHTSTGRRRCPASPTAACTRSRSPRRALRGMGRPGVRTRTARLSRRPHTVVDGGGVQPFAGGFLFRQNGSGPALDARGHRCPLRGEGGQAGSLGWPVSDEHADGDGRRQDFERGSLRWTATSGVTPVSTPPSPPPSAPGLLDRLRQALRRLLTRARPPRAGA